MCADSARPQAEVELAQVVPLAEATAGESGHSKKKIVISKK